MSAIDIQRAVQRSAAPTEISPWRWLVTYISITNTIRYTATNENQNKVWVLTTLPSADDALDDCLR